MVRFSTRYVPRLSCYIILLLCHDFVAGGRGPEQPRFTFFRPVPTESKRLVYGVSVLPGQALVIERQFLSGAWEHATLPAVPFGQEGSNPVTDVVVVLRYKFLSGKTSENAFTALSATQLNPKVEENFVIPTRGSAAVARSLTDIIEGNVRGEKVEISVLPLPPLLQRLRATSFASGMSILGKSGAGGKATVKSHGKQLANGGKAGGSLISSSSHSL